MFPFRQLHNLIWALSSNTQPEKKDSTRLAPLECDPPTLNTNVPLPILPPEIVELIVLYAACPLLPPNCAPYEDYLQTRKIHWKCLGGVVSSTKYYRHLLVKRWFAVVVLREPSDWDRVLDPNWLGGLRASICAILTATGALTASPRNRTNTRILNSFGRLTRVSLDCHRDFLRSGDGLACYPLIQDIPSSLEFLEILNAHAPDEHIINLAARCCPDLTELRLGRCTMFNNRDCVWWKAHPADHDTYMADRGVESFAGAIGDSIGSLQKLRSLHIGVYLTPIEAVWAHRVDHRKLHPIQDVMRHEYPQGIHNHLHQVALATANEEDPDPPINYHYPPLAKKEIWDAPCSECDHRFKVPAEHLEMRTACVLSARVWSLRTISFASFTSPGRVGTSSWEVRPKHNIDGRLLTGEDAAEMLPRLSQDNPPIRHVKVEVGGLDGPGGEFLERKSLIFGISNFGDTIALTPPMNETRMPSIF